MNDDFSWLQMMVMLAILSGMFLVPVVVIALHSRHARRESDAGAWDRDGRDS
jgi:uncharacterized membrane protein